MLTVVGSTPIVSGPHERPVDGPYLRVLPGQRAIFLSARPLRLFRSQLSMASKHLEISVSMQDR